MKWLSQPYWRAEPKYLELAKQRGALLVELLPNVGTRFTAPRPGSSSG